MVLPIAVLVLGVATAMYLSPRNRLQKLLNLGVAQAHAYEKMPWSLAKYLATSDPGVLVLFVGKQRWGLDWSGYSGAIPEDPAGLGWRGMASASFGRQDILSIKAAARWVAGFWGRLEARGYSVPVAVAIATLNLPAVDYPETYTSMLRDADDADAVGACQRAVLLLQARL